MQEKPLVTIVTITFNLIKADRKKFFRQCLESVHNQTFKNIEHIIIDGASTDGTIDLIKEYAEKGWITYISEPDSGIYNAMNKGIKLAKGKYIAFLHSDDYYHNSDAVSLSIEALEKESADFSYANYIEIDNEKKRIMKGYLETFLHTMPFGHPTMFTKTSVLRTENGFNEKYKIAADYDLIIRLILKDYRFVYIDNEIMSFRLGGLCCITDHSDEIALIYKENYPFYVFSNSEQAKQIFKTVIPEDFLNKFREFAVKQKFKNIDVDKLIIHLETKQKNQEILNLKQEIQRNNQELYEIRTSLRWKIPNYCYKIYKTKIKKFVPRFIFKLKDVLVVVYFKFSLVLKGISFKKIKNSIIQSDPIITIGIASYNHSKYLKQCIESALNQDYKKYDILIVDDNSSDPKNREILKSYEANEKIKIICKNKNEGISASLNDQVINAKGDWVAFVDCDDYLPANALSRMAKYIKSYPAKKLVFSNRIEVDENDKILRKVGFGNRSYDKNIFHRLTKGMVSSHLKLIHKDAFLKVGLFDDRFGGTHDYDMYLKVAFYMPEAFGHVDKYLYYHRIHASQNTIVESEKHEKNVEKMREEFRLRELVYSGNFNELVSIIILSFNRGEQTKKTIEKLLAHTRNIQKEIIIWDNGSNDDKTLEILKGLEKNAEVTIYFSKENLRCSGGRKAGAKLAKGDLLYFLDNDIEIERGALEELIIRMHESNNIAGACSKVIFPNERIQFNGGQYFKDDAFISFSLIDTGKNRTDVSAMKKIECGWIPGGATMFRREIFNSIEHDVAYVNAFEDNDFSLQITERLGMGVVNCPTSRVVHYHLEFEHFLDEGTKKYKEVRRDDEGAFINSWKRFYEKWNLIIKDDFILGIAGLREKSQEEIKKYLEKSI